MPAPTLHDAPNQPGEQLLAMGASLALHQRTDVVKHGAELGRRTVELIASYAACRVPRESCHSGQPSSRRRAVRPAACNRRTASCA